MTLAKNSFIAAMVFLACMIALPQSAAAETIDPTVDTATYFGWLGGESSDVFDITVAADSLIDIHINDGAVPGDEFAVLLDDATVPYTTTSIIDDFFHGWITDLFLGAGTHLFTIDITAMAEGHTSGGASIEFFAVTQAEDGPVPTPEPSTFLLLGVGLLGLVGVGRKHFNRA